MSDTLVVHVELWVPGYDNLESLVEKLNDVAVGAGSENTRITINPVLPLDG